MADLARKHPSVGAARSIGLFGLVELVRDKAKKVPLAPFNGTSEEMAALGEVLPRRKGSTPSCAGTRSSPTRRCASPKRSCARRSRSSTAAWRSPTKRSRRRGIVRRNCVAGAPLRIARLSLRSRAGSPSQRFALHGHARRRVAVAHFSETATCVGGRRLAPADSGPTVLLASHQQQQTILILSRVQPRGWQSRRLCRGKAGRKPRRAVRDSAGSVSGLPRSRRPAPRGLRARAAAGRRAFRGAAPD